MFRKVSRFAIALVTLSTLGWCQPPGAAVKAVRDFDARDMVAESGQASPARARQMAGRQALLAAEIASIPGSHITPNRYGYPKVFARDGGLLTGPSRLAPENIARDFLRTHRAYPFASQDVDNLRLTVRDVTPSATFLVFNQTAGGIDVFDAQIKFTMTAAGEIVQVAAGSIIPGAAVPSGPKLSAADGVAAAYRSIEVEPPLLTPADRADGTAAFLNPGGSMYNPITAELMIFPVTDSDQRLAYRIYLDQDSTQSYEILIDANSGEVLYRHNRILRASAKVWTQSPMTGGRQDVTFPVQNPWLSAGTVVTTGNNVDAYVTNPGTATGLQNGRAYSPDQRFDFPFGDGMLGVDPRNTKAAAITNLFYFVNTAHDYFYGLGFTEAAGNFQTDNYLRGGKGGDPILAAAQGITDNAMFGPTPDGAAPHMYVGLFIRGTDDPSDDLDADYDGQVVLHEYTHGVSTRLVGGGRSTSCLDNSQGGAMGEGWSDYFASSYYSNPVVGGYVWQDPIRGIRRFSYEGYPYTYEDLGRDGYEVHNDGEIWAGTLWDLRKSLGQTLTDQLVLNGLKSTPCTPSMMDARDALLSADLAANGGANRAALWQVFAKHGMGFSAKGEERNLRIASFARYDAAFDLPADFGGPAAPQISSDPLAVQVGMGDSYQYVVQASNPSGRPLTFTLESGPSGMSVDSTTGRISWTANFTGGRVKVVISDGVSPRSVHGFRIPAITHLKLGVPVTISGDDHAVGYADVMIPEGIQIVEAAVTNCTHLLRFNVSDSERIIYGGGYEPAMAFVEPPSGFLNIESGSVDGSFSGVTLLVSEIIATPMTMNSTITVSNRHAPSSDFFRVNVPPGTPILRAATFGGWTPGGFELFIRKDHPPIWYKRDPFTQGDRTEAAVTIAQPEPGDWYFTIQNAVVGGYRDVVLSVSADYQSSGLTVRTPMMLPPARPGASYYLRLDAVGGVPPYQWLLFAGWFPEGLALSDSGILSGTAAPKLTSYTFTARVVDSVGKIAYAGFYLQYTNAVPVVNVNIPCPATSPVGVAYSCGLSATGGTAPYAWTLIGGNLPPGITVSSAGLLSGTPSSPGTFSFQVRARDLGGIEATKIIQFNVITAGKTPNWLWDVVGKPKSGSPR